jgi:hypothetical protein
VTEAERDRVVGDIDSSHTNGSASLDRLADAVDLVEWLVETLREYFHDGFV